MLRGRDAGRKDRFEVNEEGRDSKGGGVGCRRLQG